MVCYFLLFLAIFANALVVRYWPEYANPYTDIFIILLLILFSGGRYHLGGSDYDIYKSVYDQIPKLDVFLGNFKYRHLLSQTFGFESGYLVLNSFGKTLGLTFYGFTLFLSFLFYALFFSGIRRFVGNYYLFLVIFMYKMFLYNTFISMRQSITIALFMHMTYFLLNRNWVKYYGLCFVCLLFHNASFVLIPLYWVGSLRLSKNMFGIVAVLFVFTLAVNAAALQMLGKLDFLIMFISDPTQIAKAHDALTSTSSEGLNWLHVVEYYAVITWVYIKFDALCNYNKYSRGMIVLLLCLIPIFTLLRNLESITRFKDYLIPVYGILLTYLVDMLGVRNKNLAMMVVCLIGIYASIGYIRYLTVFDEGGLMPYQSVFFEKVNLLGN